jgi:hypothetical protein
MSIDKRSETTSSSSRPERGFLRILRGTAMIAVVAGAAGSLGVMFRAGRHQKSLILILLFTVWVLSPFVGFVLANVVSKRWSTPARATLSVVMLVVTVASLAIYGAVAFGYTTLKVGFVFLVVPLASLVIIAIVVTVAKLISDRRTPRIDQA